MLTLKRIDGEMKNSLKTYFIMEEQKRNEFREGTISGDLCRPFSRNAWRATW